MVNLEEWMELQAMHQQGMSQSEIARQLGMHRKRVRKYLHGPPQAYGLRVPWPWKLDPYRSYLRERWEQGLHNAHKLFREIRRRGYAGGYTQARRLVSDWREEEEERAFVRFETSPGEQSHFDWAHFGNWQGHRRCGFALMTSPGFGTIDKDEGDAENRFRFMAKPPFRFLDSAEN